MDTMLAALLLLMFIGQAFGGERMSCEVQPVRGQKRSGFEYARRSEKRMIARSCEPEQSQNIIQFRPYLKFASKCAQCRLRMAILRAEPDLKARELRITYRCLECALLDRRTT